MNPFCALDGYTPALQLLAHLAYASNFSLRHLQGLTSQIVCALCPGIVARPPCDETWGASQPSFIVSVHAHAKAKQAYAQGPQTGETGQDLKVETRPTDLVRRDAGLERHTCGDGVPTKRRSCNKAMKTRTKKRKREVGGEGNEEWRRKHEKLANASCKLQHKF